MEDEGNFEINIENVAEESILQTGSEVIDLQTGSFDLKERRNADANANRIIMDYLEPPSNVVSSFTSNHTLSVYWKPVEDFSKLDGYKVMISKIGEPWYTLKCTSRLKHFCRIRINQEGRYRVGVRAIKGLINSDIVSAEKEFVIPNKDLLEEESWAFSSRGYQILQNCGPSSYANKGRSHCVIAPVKNVKLKPLPYHKILTTPVKLTALPLKGPNKKVGGFQIEKTKYCFCLEEKLVNYILNSRNQSFGTFGVQVLVRFCLQDSATIQEDTIPECILRVNGDLVLAHKRDKELVGPLDVTKLCKFKEGKGSEDVLYIEWMQSRKKSYCVTVCVAEKLDIPEIVSKWMVENVKDASITRQMVEDKLKSDKDVSCTSLKSTLTCPLGKTRIVSPCRGQNCTHIQCVDAVTLLKLNEGRPLSGRKCYMCDQPAGSIYIDGLFLEILTSVPDTVEEIEFKHDGSWTYTGKPASPPPATGCEQSQPLLDTEQIPHQCSEETGDNEDISNTESEDQNILNMIQSRLSRIKSQVDQLEFLSKQHEHLNMKADESAEVCCIDDDDDNIVIDLSDNENESFAHLAGSEKTAATGDVIDVSDEDVKGFVHLAGSENIATVIDLSDDEVVGHGHFAGVDNTAGVIDLSDKVESCTHLAGSENTKVRSTSVHIFNHKNVKIRTQKEPFEEDIERKRTLENEIARMLQDVKESAGKRKRKRTKSGESALLDDVHIGEVSDTFEGQGNKKAALEAQSDFKKILHKNAVSKKTESANTDKNLDYSKDMKDISSSERNKPVVLLVNDQNDKNNVFVVEMGHNSDKLEMKSGDSRLELLDLDEMEDSAEMDFNSGKNEMDTYDNELELLKPDGTAVSNSDSGYSGIFFPAFPSVSETSETECIEKLENSPMKADSLLKQELLKGKSFFRKSDKSLVLLDKIDKNVKEMKRSFNQAVVGNEAQVEEVRGKPALLRKQSLPEAMKANDTDKGCRINEKMVNNAQKYNAKVIVEQHAHQMTSSSKSSSTQDSDNSGCSDSSQTPEGICKSHGALHMVQDAVVPSRARLTLPSSLTLKLVEEKGTSYTGVFAKYMIPMRSQFGPLQAPVGSKVKLKVKQKKMIVMLEKNAMKKSSLRQSNNMPDVKPSAPDLLPPVIADVRSLRSKPEKIQTLSQQNCTTYEPSDTSSIQQNFNLTDFVIPSVLRQFHGSDQSAGSLSLNPPIEGDSQSAKDSGIVDTSNVHVSDSTATDVTSDTELEDSSGQDLTFEYKVLCGDNNMEVLDTTDEEQCNWMIFVRPARSLKEQNLIAYQRDGHMFFVSSKPIQANTELKVWYSVEYARSLNKGVLPQQTNTSRLLFQCEKCKKLYSNLHLFVKHKQTRCTPVASPPAPRSTAVVQGLLNGASIVLAPQHGIRTQLPQVPGKTSTDKTKTSLLAPDTQLAPKATSTVTNLSTVQPTTSLAASSGHALTSTASTSNPQSLVSALPKKEVVQVFKPSSAKADLVQSYKTGKKKRKKRKLIIDNVTEFHQEHYTRLIYLNKYKTKHGWSIAPPTKKLMEMAEVGINRKIIRKIGPSFFDEEFLRNPARPLHSKALLNLFKRNLRTSPERKNRYYKKDGSESQTESDVDHSSQNDNDSVENIVISTDSDMEDIIEIDSDTQEPCKNGSNFREAVIEIESDSQSCSDLKHTVTEVESDTEISVHNSSAFQHTGIEIESKTEKSCQDSNDLQYMEEESELEQPYHSHRGPPKTYTSTRRKLVDDNKLQCVQCEGKYSDQKEMDNHLCVSEIKSRGIELPRQVVKLHKTRNTKTKNKTKVNLQSSDAKQTKSLPKNANFDCSVSVHVPSMKLKRGTRRTKSSSVTNEQLKKKANVIQKAGQHTVQTEKQQNMQEEADLEVKVEIDDAIQGIIRYDNDGDKEEAEAPDPVPMENGNEDAVLETKFHEHVCKHTGTKYYICGFAGCDYGFVSLSVLKRHQSFHRMDCTHKCLYCDKKFNCKRKLNNHMVGHDKKKKSLKCKMCSKIYVNLSSYQKHMLCHEANRGKTLKCVICNTTFVSREKLQVHLKGHKETRRSMKYKEETEHCLDCGTNFKELKTPLVTHTKKRAFYCPPKRRFVKHTRRTEFFCPFCQKKYIRRNHLTRHINTVHSSDIRRPGRKSTNTGGSAAASVNYIQSPHGMSTVQVARLPMKCQTNETGHVLTSSQPAVIPQIQVSQNVEHKSSTPQFIGSMCNPQPPQQQKTLLASGQEHSQREERQKRIKFLMKMKTKLKKTLDATSKRISVQTSHDLSWKVSVYLKRNQELDINGYKIYV